MFQEAIRKVFELGGGNTISAGRTVFVGCPFALVEGPDSDTDTFERFFDPSRSSLSDTLRLEGIREEDITVERTRVCLRSISQLNASVAAL